jgi:hypothetical protein
MNDKPREIKDFPMRHGKCDQPTCPVCGDPKNNLVLYGKFKGTQKEIIKNLNFNCPLFWIFSFCLVCGDWTYDESMYLFCRGCWEYPEEIFEQRSFNAIRL